VVIDSSGVIYVTYQEVSPWRRGPHLDAPIAEDLEIEPGFCLRVGRVPDLLVPDLDDAGDHERLVVLV
jgi:hypothetical protein